MDFLDFLIFIFYLSFLFLFFTFKGKRDVNSEIRKIYQYALLAKIIGSVTFIFFVINSEGTDTMKVYYPYGMNLMRLILEDLSNLKLIFTSAANFDETILREVPHVGYMSSDSNLTVTKITALAGFLTLGKFMAINLFFSMIAFSGMWKLYLFFYERFPELKKSWAIVILFLPNLLFWSSSLLKDPLCIAALGWITYSAGKLLQDSQKRRIHILNLFFWSALLYLIKVYILLSYLPFLIFFLLLSYFSDSGLNLKKLLIVSGIFIILIASPYILSDFLSATIKEHMTGSLMESIISYQESFAELDYRAGSNFSLGVELDLGFGSLIKAAPYAIFATLFRPLPWEANNMTALAAAAESFLILLFTCWVLLKVGPFRVFTTLIRKPIVLYILGFALLFSVFVGLTTPNFGALSRYKAPAIPFYLAGLILILHYNRSKKTSEEKVELTNSS